MAEAAQKLDESYVKRFVLGCRDESRQAKIDRMDLNKDNYEMYQLKHDFSHKKKGQSREVLSKTRNSTEQIKSFFQQALSDLDDWWRVVPTDGSDGTTMLIKPQELQKLTNFMLKKADYFGHVGMSCQSAILGALSISKVRGEMVSKPKFVTRAEGKGKSYKKNVVAIDEKTWELRFDNIRQEDWYPDPTGSGLFEIDECEMDLHVVKQLAEGDDAIFDKEAVDSLRPWGSADLQEELKARETGQNAVPSSVRPRVKITEFWGTIVDQATGDILAENVVVTIANEDTVIRKPTPNPQWHQRTPNVAAALIEVAHSVWGIALMDAGTKHNRSLIEIFNLILDSAMKAVWGIAQLKVDKLDDPKQITDSITWGTTFKVGSSLVPGEKVYEEIVSGNIDPSALNVFNLLTQETLTSMMTNDLRMGATSQRAVKATEIVTAENTITSVFQGMSKNYEEKKIQPELELSWMTIAQNWDLIDQEIFISLFGKERGLQLSQLEPQEVFVQTVNGYRFEVFGISLTLRRQADFRKWTTFLQTIGSSEPFIEAFLQKYSFEKLLGEIMTALDINKDKIANDEPETPPGMPNELPPNPMEQPGGAPGAVPNQMSQVPQPPAGGPNPLAALAMAMPQGGGQ